MKEHPKDHRGAPINLAEDIELTPKKLEEYLVAYQKAEYGLLVGEMAEVDDLVFFGIEKDLSYQERSAFAMAWYLPNVFYPLTLISAQAHRYTHLPFFFIKSDRISYEELRTKTFRFGFYFEKNRKAVFKRFSFLDSKWASHKTWHYELMGYDKDTDLESVAEYSLKDFSLAKRYAAGVVEGRHDISVFYWRRMEEEFRNFLIGRYINPHTFPKIEEEIISSERQVKSLRFESVASTHHLFEELWAENPAGWLKKSADLINKVVDLQLNELARSLTWHQRIFLWLAPQVREGKSVPSLYLDKGYEVHFDALDLEALKGKYDEYWGRNPIDLSFYRDKTAGLQNIHVSKKEFLANCPLYEGDVSEGLDYVKSQLLEAVSLKEWTLPYGGFFQLAGAISGLKTYEINNDVFCVFCFRSGRYFQLTINPASQTYALPPDPGTLYFEGTESVYPLNGKIEWLNDRAILGLLLLASSTIRDAWVVEERETVFGEGRATRKVSPLLGDYRKQIIVYLPRIKYIRKAEDVKRAAEELNYAVRRQHWVKGHLRKAVKASPAQILLAQKHGVYIPEGKTYVQGHNRGQLAAERIYRSRSALRCLRALDAPGLGIDGWFSFEKNVKQWLESFGYEADHKAASRNGDGGIDIQASKGSEHLYVQCKYWKDPVGINVVREMIGTLITYPEGSRGVIVTSSELTIPARELAIQHGIQFVENVSFEKPIDKDLKRKK